VSDTAGSSDNLRYSSALLTGSSTFSTPLRISERAPAYSPSRGYIPTAVEFYDANNDVGALWAGFEGTNRRLYWDRLRATAVGVNEPATVIPASFELSQNFPNPFNPTTTIRFSIPEQSAVVMTIYDMLGQEVATLAEGVHNAGRYSVEWDGRNGSGSAIASGMYFCKITATPIEGGATIAKTRRMLLLK
jgi:hypothetical protein